MARLIPLLLAILAATSTADAKKISRCKSWKTPAHATSGVQIPGYHGTSAHPVPMGAGGGSSGLCCQIQGHKHVCHELQGRDSCGSHHPPPYLLVSSSTRTQTVPVPSSGVCIADKKACDPRKPKGCCTGYCGCDVGELWKGDKAGLDKYFCVPGADVSTSKSVSKGSTRTGYSTSRASSGSASTSKSVSASTTTKSTASSSGSAVTSSKSSTPSPTSSSASSTSTTTSGSGSSTSSGSSSKLTESSSSAPSSSGSSLSTSTSGSVSSISVTSDSSISSTESSTTVSSSTNSDSSLSSTTTSTTSASSSSDSTTSTTSTTSSEQSSSTEESSTSSTEASSTTSTSESSASASPSESESPSSTSTESSTSSTEASLTTSSSESSASASPTESSTTSSESTTESSTTSSETSTSLSASPSLTAVPCINLAQNPGFESALSSWQVSVHNAGAEITSTTSHSGLNSFHSSTTQFGDVYLSQFIPTPLTPGSIYKLSFFAKATWNGPPLIWRLYATEPEATTPQVTVQLYANPIYSTPGFEKYEAEFTAPEGLTDARLWVNVGVLFSTGGSFTYEWWMDDFEVVEKAEVCDGNETPPVGGGTTE